MSSAISLPNRTFTGQASSSKRFPLGVWEGLRFVIVAPLDFSLTFFLTSIVHSLALETDSWPFLNQQKRENDRRKYFMINLHE